MGQNYIGDDAVNLAESSVTVENCSWENSRADALDLDFCHGTIKHCTWHNSGNDGLDMMASDIEASDLMISGSADKGISVGENSRLRATRVHLHKCLIGTEIKDDSFALYSNCRLEECETAVHCYQKKWFYSGGGKVALVDSVFIKSGQRSVDIEKHCHAYLVNSPCEDESPRITNCSMLPRAVEAKLIPSRYGEVSIMQEMN